MAVVTVGERQCGLATILDLEGNVTFGEGTATLRRDTRRLIAEGRVEIVLNLAGVRYVDSSGLGEMVAAQTAARRCGGRVALLGLSPNVRGLFEMTRLVDVFDVYEDEPSALRGMSGGRG
ncbi:MAG: STAS domain-containing protein [Acidobacteriota bacterium]|nr:STAS domain-containing protein [Acidobacteriota bacterium]